MLAMTAGFQAVSLGALQEAEQKNEADPDSNRTGYLIKIPLPIDSNVKSDVKKKLQRLAEKTKPAVRAQDRPVVVLEFEISAQKNGRGSEVYSCVELAEYLGDSEVGRLHTVSYLPADRNNQGDDESVQLNGHAVLVALAANQLALEPGTSIGAAGADVKKLELWVREAYRAVIEQRLTTVPVEVALSMLDPEEELYRVTTTDGEVLYVGAEKLKELEGAGKSDDTRTISEKGSLAVLTQADLKKYGLVELTPDSRTDLARSLDLAPNSLDDNPADGRDWNAIQINLPNYIDEKSAQWLMKSLSHQISSEKVNLIIFNIDDNSGDFDACLRIAQRLVEFDSAEVRSIAFVRERAVGPVGLLALSCSQLIMAPESKLGGERNSLIGAEDPNAQIETEFSAEELLKIKPLVQEVAKKRQMDWSLMMSMMDPKLTVTRYRQKSTGQFRILCNEEFESLDDREDWAPLRPIGGASGIDATTAESTFIARTLAEDMGQIQTYYQLEESPRTVQPTATDRWVEKFARFLASPFVAPWLLFAAMFFFSTEMSAPGLGLPGFLATICFVLFFWSQSLDGNADWLEIILFGVGVVFVLIEIFALPGFGVFGIGGLLMIIVSVVLASQSFFIPRTNEELAQIPYSLLPVVGAGLGVIVGAITLRKVLPNSPYLRRMMLEPRKRIDTGLKGKGDPEAVVDWSHLNGFSGETITKLYPAGKARIAGEVYNVVSNGPLVDKGAKVVVIEAQGNRIVVKEVD